MKTNSIKATQKTPISMTWESITPTRAKLWLKNTEETNYAQRGLDNASVTKYAAQNANGKWHPHTGDTICITEYKGCEVCLDGQHRLQMIVQSGVSLDAWVARGVPSDAFKYKDGGKKRSLKDVMVAAGWKEASTLSQTGYFLWVHKMTGYLYGNVKPHEQVMEGDRFDWLAEYKPDLQLEFEENKSTLRKVGRELELPVNSLFFFWLKWGEVDREMRDQVFEYFSDTHMNTSPNNNFVFAVKKLRELQKLFRTEHGSVRTEKQRDAYAAVLMLSWNSAREGKHYRSENGFSKDYNLARSGVFPIPSLSMESVGDLWQAA